MRIAVIGTGVMGASAALAARRRGDTVAGWDADPDSLAVAGERGAVDPATSFEAAIEEAELVVVAVPIAQLPQTVAAALAARGDATVTDVGSTKSSAVSAADGSPRFVGSHPSCGSAARGPENASAGLFEGATWFLTPVAHTDPARHRLVHNFVSDLGATPVAIDADAPLAFVLFASSLAAVSVLEVVLYQCAVRYDLLRDEPDGLRRRHDVLAGLIPTVFLLGSIPIAFASTRAAFFVWFLMFPAEAVLDRVIPDPRKA